MAEAVDETFRLTAVGSNRGGAAFVLCFGISLSGGQIGAWKLLTRD